MMLLCLCKFVLFILGIISGVFLFIWNVFVLFIIIVLCFIVFGVNVCDMFLLVLNKVIFIFLKFLGEVFWIVSFLFLNVIFVFVECFEDSNVSVFILKFLFLSVLSICCFIVFVVLIIVMCKFFFICKIFFVN